MATFVLVHGAFAGGWALSRVAAILRAQGHDVYTPTLSGLGERAHLVDHPINLSTHIQDVVAVMQVEDLKDVILCGHSYGGMIITGVAGQIPERIKTLFYLDAALPEDGQSLFDIIGTERTLRFLEQSGETGTTIPAPEPQFFQADQSDIEWFRQSVTPQPVGTFIQKLRLTGKEALVNFRTFVRCERWMSANHGVYARVKDLPGWKAVSLDCGHNIMIEDPDTVARLLLEELTR